MFIVFYNGEHQCEDKVTLRLSDAFQKSEDGEAALECVATVLNINYGHNRELMENCRKLYEYAYFIKEIREQLAQGMTRKAAVDLAVEKCIQEGQQQMLVQMVCKKLRKGKRAELIAEELEEEPEKIKKICDVAVTFSPEYDSEQVFEALMKENTK